MQLDDLRLAHGEVTRKVIGAFYDVYNVLGFGFVESVYGSAMAIALSKRGVQFERERLLAVRYGDVLVGEFRADLIVERRVIVELKAAERIVPAHESQLLNYLRSSGLRVGLILNFGAKATMRRLIWTGSGIDVADMNG